MIRFFLICFLFISSCVVAEEATHFIYGDIHAMGGYPMVGVGVRAKKGKHGVDLSGNVLNKRLYHAKGLYLFYPLNEGFYFGGGLGVLSEPESIKGGVSGSAEGVVGYQWKLGNSHALFLDGGAIFPFKEPRGVGRVWPTLTLGLGF